MPGNIKFMQTNNGGLISNFQAVTIVFKAVGAYLPVFGNRQISELTADALDGGAVW